MGAQSDGIPSWASAAAVIPLQDGNEKTARSKTKYHQVSPKQKLRGNLWLPSRLESHFRFRWMCERCLEVRRSTDSAHTWRNNQKRSKLGSEEMKAPKQDAPPPPSKVPPPAPLPPPRIDFDKRWLYYNNTSVQFCSPEVKTLSRFKERELTPISLLET